jgi:hypothetical protein
MNERKTHLYKRTVKTTNQAKNKEETNKLQTDFQKKIKICSIKYHKLKKLKKLNSNAT